MEENTTVMMENNEEFREQLESELMAVEPNETEVYNLEPEKSGINGFELLGKATAIVGGIAGLGFLAYKGYKKYRAKKAHKAETERLAREAATAEEFDDEVVESEVVEDPEEGPNK